MKRNLFTVIIFSIVISVFMTTFSCVSTREPIEFTEMQDDDEYQSSWNGDDN